jgi:catechol 2,3-dioxygenase-like lactoylglutathione lyase family enzyme
MPQLAPLELKAFVPARDLALSLRFYTDLGFTAAWANDDMAYLHAGPCRFMLQRFYVADHANNFVMHMLVEDVDAWWAHVGEVDLLARYGVRGGAPQDKPWGIREFHLIDPSGVLWHIGTVIAPG